MTDPLLRLLWALPFVLLVGVAAALMLRRIVKPAVHSPRSALRMSLSESLQLSEHTRVHLIEFDNDSYLLVESMQHAALHVPPIGNSGAPAKLAAAWMQRLHKRRT
jgi:flagellar biogenesis protein FliO